MTSVPLSKPFFLGTLHLIAQAAHEIHNYELKQCLECVLELKTRK